MGTTLHPSNRSSKYSGTIAGLYDLEETIGRGHYAVVKLARHVFTGEKVAVKVIDKTKLDEISRDHLFQEVRCMKLVQHPHVVRLYEVIDTHTKLYLILELADGGDLYDVIMKHENGLQEPIARRYFSQVVQAISYCHQLHVVHRDLKPENVVFFEKLGVVKVTDFGFSNKYHPGEKLETSCGSLAYSAPEILLGDSYDAQAIDIWSLGVVLYMLVCGRPPFQEANDSETLTKIMDAKYTVPNHVSTECKSALSKDEYSHITATYYLLAERKLRAQMSEHQPPPTPPCRCDSGTKEKTPSPNSKISPESYFIPLTKTLESPQTNFRTLAFPTLEEEAEDQLSSDGSQRGSNQSIRKSYLRSSLRSSSHSLTSSARSKGFLPQKSIQLSLSGTNSDQEVSDIIERGCMIARSTSPSASPLGIRSRSRGGSGRNTPISISPSSPSTPTSPSQSPTQGKPRVTTRTLHSVRSSPQLVLNEIYEEENESDHENLSENVFYRTVIPNVRQRKLRIHARSNPVALSQSLARRYEHRKKLNKARIPSCSSSETSDDEDRKKKAEDIPYFIRRRDSRDDSSDNGSDSGRPLNLHIAAFDIVKPNVREEIASQNQNNSNKNIGASQSTTRSEETRVSSSHSLNSLTDLDDTTPRIFIRQCSNNEEDNHRVLLRRRSSAKSSTVGDVKSLCSKSTDCLLNETKEVEGKTRDSTQSESMLSALRNRLHKAKSLGTLVKGMNHCQQEIWKRFSGVSLSVKKSSF
ncbi:SNF-related serine/threonine-protein kinase-like isoform X2 [Artemia franciscana]|uniref:SNF-related serine/threonine-protein kinase-like isoform X2 n=1 Tax=Artemia franciscana TaxID=6661 RepID=UPI0032D9E050